MTAELAVAAACMARGLSAEDAEMVGWALLFRGDGVGRAYSRLDEAIECIRAARISAARSRTIADCMTCGEPVTGTHVCRASMEDQ